MKLSRDSILLWLPVVGALITYLLAAKPPAQWDYYAWLQFVAAVIAVAATKLQTSPLKGDKEIAAAAAVDLRKMGPLVLALLFAGGSIGCAPPPPNLTPPGVIAFHADRAIKGVATLQTVAIQGEAAGAISTADARVVVEATRIAGLAGQDLAAALKAGLPAADAKARAIATIRSALATVPGQLSPATRKQIEPYVTVVLTALAFFE